MTAERLAEIKARAEVTTKGPCEYGKRGDGSMWMSIGNPEAGPHIQADWEFGENNAAAFKAARADIPNLIAALEAAQARIAELEARLDGANAARQDEVFGLHEIIVEMSRELAARAKIDAAREVPRG